MGDIKRYAQNRLVGNQIYPALPVRPWELTSKFLVKNPASNLGFGWQRELAFQFTCASWNRIAMAISPDNCNTCIYFSRVSNPKRSVSVVLVRRGIPPAVE